MKIFLLIFLLVPLVEVYLLVQVGSVVGAFSTVALVVGTAVLGAVLVRAQGFTTIARVRAQLARDELPAMEILEGVFLLVAGLLLLTPGFFTDSIGFVCLTPSFRRALIRRVLTQVKVTQRETQGKVITGRVLDGEFRDLDR